MSSFSIFFLRVPTPRIGGRGACENLKPDKLKFFAKLKLDEELGHLDIRMDVDVPPGSRAALGALPPGNMMVPTGERFDPINTEGQRQR